MTGLPNISAEGTLVGDPELRFTPNGTAVAKFRIACNERKFSKGEWVEGSTTYLTGSAWRKLGEHLTESLRKGDRVVVAGSLRQREWEADDGTMRYEYEIDAHHIGPSLLFGPSFPDDPGNGSNTTDTEDGF
jgi:single-strand DNA-binding protein